MQEPIEIQAASVEEAKSKAAQQFGVPENQIEVTIIDEVKGLFGKGTVRVSASVMDTPPAKESKPKRGGKTTKPKETAVPVEIQAPPPADSEFEPEDEGRDHEHVQATEQDAERIVSMVNAILESGDLEASVHAQGVNGKYVNLEIDGRDVAYLIGKHGEVLNAMQYLLNVIVAKQLDNGVRVTVDGGNYRRKREEALENLAVRIAEQVRERGEEAVLDALPAFERRVVHKALAEFDGISTYSEGEEPNRRVVIAPAD